MLENVDFLQVIRMQEATTSQRTLRLANMTTIGFRLCFILKFHVDVLSSLRTASYGPARNAKYGDLVIFSAWCACHPFVGRNQMIEEMTEEMSRLWKRGRDYMESWQPFISRGDRALSVNMARSSWDVDPRRRWWIWGSWCFHDKVARKTPSNWTDCIVCISQWRRRLLETSQERKKEINVQRIAIWSELSPSQWTWY